MGKLPCAVVLGSGLALASAGCQVIFGFERVNLVEEAPSGCTLPAEGEAGVRLAQLIPGDATMDLCVQRSGRSLSRVHPLLDTSGRDCPDGFAYKDVSARVGLEPGAYRFLLIPGDGECTDPPLAELDADVEAGVMTTLVVVGLDPAHASLVALREAPAAASAVRARLVHAMPDLESVTVDGGILTDTTDPSSLALSFRDVPFGGVAVPETSASGGDDDDGETGYRSVGLRIDLKSHFAVRRTAAAELLTQQPVSLAVGRSYSVFAIGSGNRGHELWVCDEREPTSGYRLECGQPASITVEAYATQLTDLFVPDLDARVPQIEKTVTDLTVDLACLSEVYDADLLTRLEAAAGDRYLVVRGDDDSLVVGGDLSLRDGTAPVPTPIPCVGSAAETADALLTCLADKCSSDGQSFASSGIQATACVGSSDGCLRYTGSLANPATVAEEELACWGCLLPSLAAGQTFDEVRRICTTPDSAEERWAYGRTPGVLVLARADRFEPVEEDPPELHRLPSFGWQKGTLRVPLAHRANGARLDFYCTHLTYQPDDTNLYVGPYGDGAIGNEGAANEHRLQVERLLEFVEARTGVIPGRRAIVAGELYASPRASAATSAELQAFRSTAFDLLTETLLPLHAPDFVPTCTWCQNNPVCAGRCDVDSATERGYWFAHLLGLGFRPDQISTTTVTHRDRTVDGVDIDCAIPPSLSYGLRSQLELTQ